MNIDVEALVVELYRLLVLRSQAPPEVVKVLDELSIVSKALKLLDQQQEFTDCFALD